MQRKIKNFAKELVSTPHGGLATSTHHIKNNKTYQAFVKGAPLSSEGGLPEVAGYARLSVVLSNLDH